MTDSGQPSWRDAERAVGSSGRSGGSSSFDSIGEQPSLVHQILAATSDHVFAFDRQGRYLYASPSGAAALGLSPEAMLGKTWRELGLPADVMERLESHLKFVFATGQPTVYEGPFPTVQGVRSREYVLRAGGESKNTIVVCMVRDVTGRRNTEDELWQSEQRFRLIASNSPDTVSGQDAGLHYVWVVNPTPPLTEEQIVGKTDFDLVPPEEAGAVAATKRRVLETGESAEFDTRVVIGGQDRWYSSTFQAERDAEGRIVGLLGYSREITERKRAEAEQEWLLEQIRQANQRLVVESLRTRELAEEVQRRAAELDASISSIADGITILDLDGNPVRMNAAAQRLLRYSQEEMDLSQSERAFLVRPETPEGKPFLPEELPAARALLGENVSNVVMVVRRPPDQRIWVSVSAAAIRAEDGRLLGAILSYTDITALKTAEIERERLLGAEQEARRQAERAVRLRDEFLSLAAHELKTPLTSLKGFAQAIVRKHKSGILEEAQLLRAMGHIDRQTVRLDNLAEQLLDVSCIEAGKVTIALKETDLSSLVDHAIASQRMVHPDRVFPVRAAQPVWAGVDPLKIEQVIANLVDNAVKFSPAETPVETDVALDGSDRVAISVRDYGTGVPEDERRKVFDRFYQAHPQDHFGGLGLGLYISAQLVEMHGGSITCEAPEGVGARFVVRLPLQGMVGRLD